MPVFLTQEMKGKELFFDLAPTGSKERKEGFWSLPIFESDRQAARQALIAAGGNDDKLWIFLLEKHITRWVGFKDMNGKDIPCTPENIRSLCDSDFATMLGFFNMILDAANTGKILAEKN